MFPKSFKDGLRVLYSDRESGTHIQYCEVVMYNQDEEGRSLNEKILWGNIRHKQLSD